MFGVNEGNMIKLMSIAGARPNFMKLASIAHAIEKYNELSSPSSEAIDHVIVHTGQHYDKRMSEGFFDDLDIPRPNVNLDVGSGTHAKQTAEIMSSFEPVLMNHEPDILLVVGDVNSTIACSLVASKVDYCRHNKLKRPLIVHVEAGLRSFDRDMPEEINRVLTDSLSDVFFITEQSGEDNLLNEGVSQHKIHFVGNVMIDTLVRHMEKANSSSIHQKLKIEKPYVLVTLHRPSNVDRHQALEAIVSNIERLSETIQVVFPVHPRTKNALIGFQLWQRLEENNNVILSEPLGYLDFLYLVKNSKAVITDSGGIQEETTYLQIPCVTLRENTERPVTVSEGTNYLIGSDPEKLIKILGEILGNKLKESKVPKYWDGFAGKRIIETLVKLM